jgi:hypothetical protein
MAKIAPFKYFIFFLIGNLYLREQLSAQNNCSQFKNGSFKIVDDKTGTSFIKRYGNIQSEILEGKKDSSVFFVTWINSCSYILIPTKETFQLYPTLPKNAQLTVLIKETGANYYIQTSSSNFIEGEVTSKVIKMGALEKPQRK